MRDPNLSLWTSTPSVLKTVIRIAVSFVGHPRRGHQLRKHVNPRSKLAPFQRPIQPERKVIGHMPHGNARLRVHRSCSPRRCGQFSLRRRLHSVMVDYPQYKITELQVYNNGITLLNPQLIAIYRSTDINDSTPSLVGGYQVSKPAFSKTSPTTGRCLSFRWIRSTSDSIHWAINVEEFVGEKNSTDTGH